MEFNNALVLIHLSKREVYKIHNHAYDVGLDYIQLKRQWFGK